MTVGELIEELQWHDKDLEVCVAYQPNYPMQIHLQQQVVINENGTKLYLIEHDGKPTGHLNSFVQGEIGW